MAANDWKSLSAKSAHAMYSDPGRELKSGCDAISKLIFRSLKCRTIVSAHFRSSCPTLIRFCAPFGGTVDLIIIVSKKNIMLRGKSRLRTIT